MVILHPFMYIYDVEVMWVSRCVFNDDNTHIGPIFGAQPVPETPKMGISGPITGPWWPVIHPQHGPTTSIHVYIWCRGYMTLSLCFRWWQHQQSGSDSPLECWCCQFWLVYSKLYTIWELYILDLGKILHCEKFLSQPFIYWGTLNSPAPLV